MRNLRWMCARVGAVVALGCASVGSGGCSLLQQAIASDTQKPTLTFQGARLAEASLTGATLDLDFRVDNPNPVGLTLADTDYRLLVEGKQLVAGKPAGNLTLPASGSAIVTLPATVKFAELADSIAALLGKESIGYRAEGHIGVQTSLGVVALPFATEGRIDLPRLPRLTLGAPTLTGISFSGATLNLPITLENPNAFALPLAGVRGTLKVSGSELGSFASPEVGILAAQGRATVTLPVALRFSVDAFRALQSGRAELAVSGVLSSGGAQLPFSFAQTVDVH